MILNALILLIPFSLYSLSYNNNILIFFFYFLHFILQHTPVGFRIFLLPVASSAELPFIISFYSVIRFFFFFLSLIFRYWRMQIKRVACSNKYFKYMQLLVLIICPLEFEGI